MQLFKPQVDREILRLIKNEKMTCKIGNRKLAYVDETKHFEEIGESSLR